MRALLRKLCRDTAGGSIVEVALILPILLLLTGGTIEILYVFWQYNMAVKAAERGARIAAVSDPIATDLPLLKITGGTIGASYPAGSYGPVVCSATGTTYAEMNVTCTGDMGQSKDAFAQIFYGRGSTTCDDAGDVYTIGMCDIFPDLLPSHVTVIYESTGIGFYGEPNGPSPTVRVQVQNVAPVIGFLRLAEIMSVQMPAITASVTGEDLSSSGT